MNAMKIKKKNQTSNTTKMPNPNKQQKTPHAQQGYNHHQSMVRDIFLLGI